TPSNASFSVSWKVTFKSSAIPSVISSILLVKSKSKEPIFSLSHKKYSLISLYSTSNISSIKLPISAQTQSSSQTTNQISPPSLTLASASSGVNGFSPFSASSSDSKNSKL